MSSEKKIEIVSEPNKGYTDFGIMLFFFIFGIFMAKDDGGAFLFIFFFIISVIGVMRYLKDKNK